jgi:hypothetical protein
VLALPAIAAAQPTSVEPIRCWRQSSVGAVSIGETFTVTLTCAVVHTDETQVIPDESRLNVASIQMAPFEILGGSHPDDVRRGLRRFFQYDYQLRIISRDAIGQDVNVPAVTISYRIDSKVGANAKLEGRDLSYLVPALPIKVLSVVPADAADIRDSAEAGFATVQTLRTRARTFRAVAYALGALAAVMAVLALVPIARRARSGSERGRALASARVVADRAAAALTETHSRAGRDGWNDDLLSSALAAARLIAATAIGQEISHKVLLPDGTVPEGRLLVEHGFPRRIRVTVSSAVTPDDLTRALSGNHSFSMTRAQQLEALRSALAALTAALYRRSPERDAATVDESVRQAIAAARGQA